MRVPWYLWREACRNGTLLGMDFVRVLHIAQFSSPSELL